nr:hypothetical protein [Tanacetum cinerariifolium]
MLRKEHSTFKNQLKDMKMRGSCTPWMNYLRPEHYNICHFPQRQFWGISGDLSPGIGFPGDMSPGKLRTEKLEWDTFPGDIPGRQRRAHIVSVKQLSATVEGFLGRHLLALFEPSDIGGVRALR